MEWRDRAEYLYPQNVKNRKAMDLTIWKAFILKEFPPAALPKKIPSPDSNCPDKDNYL